MTQTLTELNYSRLTSRKRADVDARPMIFNPDTTANIASYTGLVTGDTIFDTTLGKYKVYNGTTWVVAGVIVDTWANIIASTATEGTVAVASDLNAQFVYDGSYWVPTAAWGDTELIRLRGFQLQANDDSIIEDIVSANGTATFSESGVVLNTGTTSAVDYARLALYDAGDAGNPQYLPGDTSSFMIFVKATVATVAAADNSVFLGITHNPGNSAIPAGGTGSACNFGVYKPAADATLMVALDDNDTKDYEDGATGVDIGNVVPFTVLLDCIDSSACQVWVNGTNVTATALAAANSAAGETAFDISTFTGVGPKATDFCCAIDNTTTTTTGNTLTISEFWILKVA